MGINYMNRDNMAFSTVVISGLIGLATSLVALFGYGVSFPYALALYFVFSIVPVALAMALVYLHMQISRAMAAHGFSAEARRIQR